MTASSYSPLAEKNRQNPAYGLLLFLPSGNVAAGLNNLMRILCVIRQSEDQDAMVTSIQAEFQHTETDTEDANRTRGLDGAQLCNAQLSRKIAHDEHFTFNISSGNRFPDHSGDER